MPVTFWTSSVLNAGVLPSVRENLGVLTSRPLGCGVGEGLIHAFLCEDAGHFIEDLSGPAGALDLGEGSGQFIDAGEASGTGLLCGLTQALAFFPALGLFRLGEVGLVGALDGFQEVCAD